MEVMLEKQLLSALEPFYTLRSFLGLAPLNGKRTLVSYLKGVVLISLFLISSFNEPEENSQLIFINGILIKAIKIMFAIITVATILSEFMQQRKIIKIFRYLFEVDSVFKKHSEAFEVTIDYDYIRTSAYVLVSMCVVAAIAILGGAILLNWDDFFWSYIASYTFKVLCSIIIITQTLFQFCGHLYIIRQRFIWINKQVQKYSTDINKSENTPMNFKNNNDFSEQLIITKVSCQIHCDLVDMCHLVNESYNTQILFFIAVSFTVGVTQGYTLLIMFFDAPIDNIYVIVMVIIWVFYHILGVLILAISCHLTACAAANTGVLLHKMINKDQPALKKAVEIWSLQLMHEKVIFQASGYFSIDMTMIYGMVGSITTYLVILIQFYTASLVKTASASVNGTRSP